jgi:uncharacterized protein (TIGR00251 family)
LADGPPFAVTAEGVRVAVRVTPKAKRDAIAGLKPTAGGGSELAVQLTAAPEKGRANEALLELLAREWRVPRRILTLAAGAGGRHKAVLVKGDGAVLRPRLAAWLESLSE